jgi:hypothetical protein
MPWNQGHNATIQRIRAAMEPKVHLVTVDELLVQTANNVSLHQQAFLYDSHEFAAALKPLAFSYAFQVLHAQSALYLECDYWIRDTLPAAIASLAKLECPTWQKGTVVIGDRVEALWLRGVETRTEHHGVSAMAKA